MRQRSNKKRVQELMKDPSKHVYMWTPGIYDGSRHFVFFDTLPSEKSKALKNQWSHARNFFASPYYDSAGYTPLMVTAKLENSLDFLYQIIMIERNKELAYANSFLARNHLSNVSLPNSPETWISFFSAVQEAQTNTGDFLEALKKEKARIESNIAYIKKTKANKSQMSKKEYEQALRGYEHGEDATLARNTEARINNIISGTFRKNNFSTEVSEFVVNRYSHQLVDYMWAGKDPRVILAGVQMLVVQLIYVQLNRTLTGKNGIFEKNSTKAQRQQIMGNLLEENGLLAQLDTIMNDQNTLNSFEQAIYSSFGMSSTPAGNTNASNILSKMIIKAESQSGRASSIDLKNLPKMNSNFCNVSIQRGQMSEMRTAVSDFVARSISEGVSAQGSFGSGRNTMFATDVMQIVITSNSDTSKEYANSIVNEFYAFNEKMQKRYKDISSRVRSGANTEEITKMYQDYYRVLEQKMVEYRKLYDDAAQLFHVEVSNKSYESMGLNGTNEFKGASLGSDAQEIAQRISMITSGTEKLEKYISTGGVSAFDIEWLSNAIINCGAHMAARGFKSDVINYLQIFAGLLLFDDFGKMAQDYVNTLALNAQNMDTGVSTIHLYKLQNFYLPSSYVLEQAYTHMKKTLQNIGQEVKDVGHGVRVMISGNDYQYVKPTPKYNEKGEIVNREEYFLTEEKWEKEGEKAMQATKVEMTFMGSFLDFLNEFVNTKY